MNRLKKYLNQLSNLLYPQYCLHCEEGVPGPSIFCENCQAQITRLSESHCFICSIPFESSAATSHSPDHRCGECRENLPAFSKAVTPFLYEGPLSSAICQFKYQKKPHLAVPLAGLMMNDLAGIAVGGIDSVMAIPLHPSRLRSREFNQSLLLAREIGKATSVPYSIDALIRTRETQPQVGLSRKERHENIKGAFQVTRPNEIKDHKILLVDDVYTTGATLKEASKIVIQSGAKEVIVATIARMTT